MIEPSTQYETIIETSGIINNLPRIPSSYTPIIGYSSKFLTLASIMLSVGSATSGLKSFSAALPFVELDVLFRHQHEIEF